MLGVLRYDNTIHNNGNKTKSGEKIKEPKPIKSPALNKNDFALVKVYSLKKKYITPNTKKLTNTIGLMDNNKLAAAFSTTKNNPTKCELPLINFSSLTI